MGTTLTAPAAVLLLTMICFIRFDQVIGLKCVVCNSALRGHEICASLTGNESIPFVHQCDNVADYMGNLKNLYPPTQNGTAFMSVDDLMEKPIPNESAFVCRKVVTKIPYAVLKYQPFEDRVVRLCGVLGVKEEHDHCVSRALSAKSSTFGCTCDADVDGKPCNLVGRFKSWAIFVAFTLVFVIVLSFGE